MTWISRLWDSIKPKPVTSVPAPTARSRSKFMLSARSLTALAGVHPDLVKVVHRAIELTEVDFIVTEGRRSLVRQRELVAQGASKTLNSRHITGHAVDVVAYQNGKGNYNAEAMRAISKAFKAAAAELQVPIDWGGDWKSFKDTPHFELNRKVYPA